MEPRIIVAQPPFGPAGIAALKAGVLYFPNRESAAAMTLVVKAALSFAPLPDGSLDEEPEIVDPPWPCAARRSELLGATPDELGYPNDLVPEREGVCVSIVGHGVAEMPSARIDASFTVGEISRAFSLVAGGAAARLPLSDAYLRATDGEGKTPPVGPVMLRNVDQGRNDAGRYACASAPQRMETLAPDGTIELSGLSARAPKRVVRLPGLVPVAIAASRSGEEIPVALACDTLWIDVDREQIVLVWRGAIPLISPEAAWTIPRIDVWLEPSDAPRDLSSVRRALHRGHFAYAVESEEAAAWRAPPSIPPEELSRVKYGLWDESPEGRLPLDRYAWIAAELQEKREPRDVTLRRHALDEDGFALEERAWMEHMASAAMAGDAEPAKRFGDSFLAAQEALAAPEEAARDVDAYAPIRAAMDRGADPSKVLAAFAMTLPTWMRLDRRMARAAAAEEALRAEIDRKITEAVVDPKLLDDDAILADAADDDDDEDDA